MAIDCSSAVDGIANTVALAQDLPQLLVADPAGEVHLVRDAEALRLLLELLADVALADEVELRVQVLRDAGDRLDQVRAASSRP